MAGRGRTEPCSSVCTISVLWWRVTRAWTPTAADGAAMAAGASVVVDVEPGACRRASGLMRTAWAGAMASSRGSSSAQGDERWRDDETTRRETRDERRRETRRDAVERRDM